MKRRRLLIDNFAGGGGASTGMYWAFGRPVDHANNHNREALSMHRINHPETVHHTCDVWEVDPEVVTEGEPVEWAHFSPDCTHFTKARTGKPKSKRIRGLVLVMLRWAARTDTWVLSMENVEEIQTWGPLKWLEKNGAWDWYPDPEHEGRTWQAFLDCLSTGIDPAHPDLPEILDLLRGTVTKEELVAGLGYQYEYRELRACDYGTPTTRNRLFMIARCDGEPIVWPEPTHFDPKTLDKDDVRPAWRTIAECLDFTLPCPSIFLRGKAARKAKCRRPLADNTLRRIAKGIQRYVLEAEEPFIVSLTHQGGDRVEATSEPARTVTGARRGEKALVLPKLAQSPFLTEHANGSKQRVFPANEPMRTQCAQVKGGHFAAVGATLVGAGGPSFSGKPTAVNRPFKCLVTENHTALAAAGLVKMRGDNVGQPASEALRTVSAQGQHHGLFAASLVREFGASVGQSLDRPAPTVMAGGGGKTGVVAASMAAYYGSERDGQAVTRPLRTQETKARFCHVEATCEIPPLTAAQMAGARRVAKFLRRYGVEFEGEFATVTDAFGQVWVIVDIGMRMLRPRELYLAQGFPADYVIDRGWVVDPGTGEITVLELTVEQQIKMCGNSVCPQVMEALVKANAPSLNPRRGRVWEPSTERMAA